MTIYTAKELLPKLRNLVIWGQDEDGDLEWMGTDKEWKQAEREELEEEMTLDF